MQEFRTHGGNESLQPIGSALPDHRSQWPRQAKDAYFQVLSELNSWSREVGEAAATNGWAAETAVREAWAPTQPVPGAAHSPATSWLS